MNTAEAVLGPLSFHSGNEPRFSTTEGRGDCNTRSTPSTACSNKSSPSTTTGRTGSRLPLRHSKHPQQRAQNCLALSHNNPSPFNRQGSYRASLRDHPFNSSKNLPISLLLKASARPFAYDEILFGTILKSCFTDNNMISFNNGTSVAFPHRSSVMSLAISLSLHNTVLQPRSKWPHNFKAQKITHNSRAQEHLAPNTTLAQTINWPTSLSTASLSPSAVQQRADDQQPLVALYSHQHSLPQSQHHTDSTAVENQARLYPAEVPQLPPGQPQNPKTILIHGKPHRPRQIVHHSLLKFLFDNSENNS